MNRILSCTLVLLTYAHLLAQNPKVLIIGTNVNTFNNKVNGTYLVEIAPPFQYFLDQGFEVDIVSPSGGEVAIYQDKISGRVDSVSKTKAFITKISNSLKPDQTDPSHYSIVYIPGGYGQFTDVCKNNEIGQLISRAYEHGAAVGTAGHGAASLTYVTLKNGAYLVKGKRMTCFPTWVEKEYMEVSAYGKAVPFDMQAELAKNGALLTVSTKENQNVNPVVVDTEHKLVTGSFANNAETVAVELIKMINKPSGQ